MRRRLPLLGLASAASSAVGLPRSAAGSGARLALADGSIGIADTGDGLAAASLAVELSHAFASLGQLVAIVLVGFEGVPVLPQALAAALGEVARVSAHAIDPGGPTLPADPRLAAEALQLWVGAPAVTVFAPSLSLLLGADRPLTSWPARLRASRSTCQLELSQNRPGLSRALASALNEHGFLLRA